MIDYLESLGIFTGQYFQKYKKLILENQIMPPRHSCIQKHHIIPRHVFEQLQLPVDNSEKNIVSLSCIDHFIAHIYLAKAAVQNNIEYANYASAAFILTRINFLDNEELSVLANEMIKEFSTTRKIIFGKRAASLMQDPSIRQIHDDKMRSIEVREKISKSMFEYRATHEITAETRKKLAESQLDKVHIKKGDAYKRINKEELQKYLSLGWERGGAPITMEHHKALAEAKFKPVYCVILDSGESYTFESTKAGAIWWQQSGLESATHTRGVCTKIKKSIEKAKAYNGVQWFYCK